MFCVNGRLPPQIDERTYLGTDKSVPYTVPIRLCPSFRDGYADLTDFKGMARGFTRISRILSTQITKRRYIFPRANPLNPRKSVKSVFHYL
ncbi:MAG: hypothetical protein FWG87_05055 [Defluviitaleaceae bacterium]|nr:hypothetical protein [Defluviitaleaceae bacterium]